MLVSVKGLLLPAPLMAMPQPPINKESSNDIPLIQGMFNGHSGVRWCMTMYLNVPPFALEMGGVEIWASSQQADKCHVYCI
jgi:hypothetical protein